jgi:phosphate transport system substrate-binding protein
MKTITAIALLVASAMPAAQAVQLDPKIPAYKPAQGVSGTISSKGSDTMNNLMTLWTEGFKKQYPGVQVSMEGKGSGSAPPALVDGTANFGCMSREMKQDEIDKFEKAFGYKPTAIPTSIDTLAVFVHKDNPLASLTLPQIDAIFSKTRNGKFEKEIKTWGDLGLTGEWADKPISLYGRNSSSGTYTYFKEHALFKGDFREGVKEQPGSSAVVQAVSGDKYAMGYSGIAAKTDGVRALALSKAADKPAVTAELARAYDGTYPMARFLYVYVNLKPGTELDPLRREFVRYILSKDGQTEVVKEGFFPLTADIANRSLAAVGIKALAIEAGSIGGDQKPK